MPPLLVAQQESSRARGCAAWQTADSLPPGESAGTNESKSQHKHRRQRAVTTLWHRKHLVDTQQGSHLHQGHRPTLDYGDMATQQVAEFQGTPAARSRLAAPHCPQGKRTVYRQNEHEVRQTF